MSIGITPATMRAVFAIHSFFFRCIAREIDLLVYPMMPRVSNRRIVGQVHKPAAGLTSPNFMPALVAPAGLLALVVLPPVARLRGCGLARRAPRKLVFEARTRGITSH